LRQKDRLIALAADEADERARAAAAEERLRIARELHDVLAHSVSLMVVQAEAAEEMLEPDPAATRRALRHIQDAGRSALAETGSLLRGLRETGPAVEWGQASEAGLEALEGLLVRMREAGVVIHDQVATPARLSDEVSATAYRVIQESLTNALRHAGTGVTVDLTIREVHAGLDIDIQDHGGSGSFDAPGHGLRGMHERVHELGGTLEYGRSEDGFRVHVTLPLVDSHAGADPQSIRSLH
jgi:signal transduction histidine kinase